MFFSKRLLLCNDLLMFHRMINVSELMEYKRIFSVSAFGRETIYSNQSTDKWRFLGFFSKQQRKSIWPVWFGTNNNLNVNYYPLKLKDIYVEGRNCRSLQVLFIMVWFIQCWTNWSVIMSVWSKVLTPLIWSIIQKQNFSPIDFLFTVDDVIVPWQGPHPLTASLTIEYMHDVQTKQIYVVEITTEKLEFRKVFSKALMKESWDSDKVLTQANAMMLQHPILSALYGKSKLWIGFIQFEWKVFLSVIVVEFFLGVVLNKSYSTIFNCLLQLDDDSLLHFTTNFEGIWAKN